MHIIIYENCCCNSLLFVILYIRYELEVKTIMQVVMIIIQVLLAIFAIVLIGTILLQPSKRPGMSSAISGGAETSFGKKKAHGREAKMNKLTKISAICFMALAVVLMILSKFFAA